MSVTVRRRRLDLLIFLIVLSVGIYAVWNAQSVGDWLHSVSYRPPSEISRLADDAGMNDEGKNLFYRFSPQLVDTAVLEQKCGPEKLGCTEGRSIYILQSDNKAEYARAIVTAAHEMLHVAYSRLTDTKRQPIHDDIDELLKNSGNAAVRDIKTELATYDQEDYYNEAHSYIGSELAEAGPDLTEYYGRYFTDRNKVTNAFKSSPEGQPK